MCAICTRPASPRHIFAPKYKNVYWPYLKTTSPRRLRSAHTKPQASVSEPLRVLRVLRELRLLTAPAPPAPPSEHTHLESPCRRAAAPSKPNFHHPAPQPNFRRISGVITTTRGCNFPFMFFYGKNYTKNLVVAASLSNFIP